MLKPLPPVAVVTVLLPLPATLALAIVTALMLSLPIRPLVWNTALLAVSVLPEELRPVVPLYTPSTVMPRAALLTVAWLVAPEPLSAVPAVPGLPPRPRKLLSST